MEHCMHGEYYADKIQARIMKLFPWSPASEPGEWYWMSKTEIGDPSEIVTKMLKGERNRYCF